MAWARLDDRWHDHPKVIAAGLEAVGLWSMCLTWAHHNRRKAERPGFVPKEVVTRFAAGKATRLARRLTEVGLFDPADGGWMIHDFTRYLPKYDSAKAAESGRMGAEARWGEPPDEPPPDGESPWDLDGGLPSDRHVNRHGPSVGEQRVNETEGNGQITHDRKRVAPPRTGADISPPHGADLQRHESDRWRFATGFGSEPMATRADPPASARRNPVPISTSLGYLSSSVTKVDARETPSLLPLREALDAVRLHVRWDRLAPDAADRVVWLVGAHGIPALVAAAQRAWQPNDPPAYANAWLAAWDSLPLPKPRLVAVLCDVHESEQPCRGCAADAKAGTA